MLTKPLCVYVCMHQCAHLPMYCMLVCLHVCSQVTFAVHSESQFLSNSSSFSSLSTHSLASPLDMDRLSQVALSDCYHWLVATPLLCSPHTLSHVSLPLSHPLSPLLPLVFFGFSCLSSVFGCALTWLSLWVCFFAALCLLFFTSPDQRGELESI